MTLKNTFPEISQDLEHVHGMIEGHDPVATLKRALVNAVWGIVKGISGFRAEQKKQTETLKLILERLNMAVDTTQADQQAAQALTDVQALAASHASSDTAGQAAVDELGAKFANISTVAKAATPAATVTGTGGADTLPAAAGQ